MMLLSLFLLVVVASASPTSSAQQLPPQRHLRASTRIVGGAATKLGTHPYFAEWHNAACGASVIHEDFVISAGHCLTQTAVRNDPGYLFLNSIQRGQSLQREIIAEFPHPLYYDGLSYKHDFVLLKTDSNMLVADAQGTLTGVRPIALNRNTTLTSSVNSTVMTVGYGHTDETDTTMS
jgi:secreted trypsin-like serine protease